jgi:hypothetical protein
MVNNGYRQVAHLTFADIFFENMENKIIPKRWEFCLLQLEQTEGIQDVTVMIHRLANNL